MPSENQGMYFKDEEPGDRPRQFNAKPPRQHKVGQAQSQQAKQSVMDLVQASKSVEQKHSTIEQQFNFERPVDAVNMRYTKEAVNHD